MKFSFPLSPTQQKFYGLIIDTILKYYPVGLKGDDPEYQKFPGQIQLGEIIVDNIHNRKNYKTRWTDFGKEIKKASKKKIEGQTYGLRPGFSSSVILKQFIHDELTHRKTLHFSVSLIGPFFTIYGVDETWIVDESRHYGAINVVTVSPYKEFESIFNLVRDKIEKRFQGYKFIPFRLHSMLIENLHDPYNNHEINDEYSIYTALFDNALEDYNTYKMRGDSHYGFNEWIDDNDRPHVVITRPTPDN